MNETAAYIVTSEVLITARAMAKASSLKMSDEEFDAAPPQADQFLEEATILFMERHEKIHKMIAKHSMV